MRYVTLRFEDQAGIVRAIRSAALPGSIRRGPVHHLNLLADGSMVRLESVAGDLRAYADALAASEAVYASSVVHGAASRTRADGDADRAGHAYLHYEPTAAAGAFVRWRRQFPIVLATPIEFDDEAVLVTLVGAVGNFTDATAALPDCLECEIEATGRFRPTASTPFRGLTDRQREILANAIDLGYYENPREATQADVGAALSLAPGTVGDHLRTIEAHVFSDRSGLPIGAISRP